MTYPTKEIDMNNAPASSYKLEPLKWFHFSQNNSGGYFIRNEDVAEDVYVQAVDAKQATAFAEMIFEDYSEFCECCGPRWTTDYIRDEDGYDVPTKYDEPVDEIVVDHFNKEARLQHFDGRVESYTYKQPTE